MFFSLHLTIQESRQFFGQVYRDFESSGVTPLMMYIVLVTLALILVSVLAYLVFSRIKARHQDEKQYFGEITGQETISSIIDQAVIQRSKISARFGPKNKPFDCAIYRAEKGEIVLEPPYFVKPTRKWLKRDLECSFRVGLDRSNFLFYTFVSPIIGFEDMQDIRMLRLTYPRSLLLGQKRRHLRLEPPTRWIKGLVLWPAAGSGRNDFEPGMDAWGKPVARMGGNKAQIPELGLIDISAGGARLRLSREVSSRLEEMREDFPYVFLYIGLDHESKGVDRYLLAARIKHSHVQYDQDFFSVSLEFVRSGRIKDKKSKRVEWKEVDPVQGVEELGNWVFQRHLKLYRERGTG